MIFPQFLIAIAGTFRRGTAQKRGLSGRCAASSTGWFKRGTRAAWWGCVGLEGRLRKHEAAEEGGVRGDRIRDLWPVKRWS
jgi:hypothetical protein